MTTVAPSAQTASTSAAPETPEVEHKRTGEQVALALFIGVPFLALLAAIPVAWGWGLGWRDIVIAFVMYAIAGHGVTVGYHRHFTHGSFKARRGLKIALAVAGSLAIEGSPTQWVADHRRHHQFSDMEGDPHSPWRYGATYWGLVKGLWYSHVGWLFHREMSNRARFAPDLVADKDIQRVDKLFSSLRVSV